MNQRSWNWIPFGLDFGLWTSHYIYPQCEAPYVQYLVPNTIQMKTISREEGVHRCRMGLSLTHFHRSVSKYLRKRVLMDVSDEGTIYVMSWRMDFSEITRKMLNKKINGKIEKLYMPGGKGMGWDSPHFPLCGWREGMPVTELSNRPATLSPAWLEAETASGIFLKHSNVTSGNEEGYLGTKQHSGEREL